MSNITKNYAAQGGDEWVIGGQLTFLPGATVQGAEGLLDSPMNTDAQLPYVADSTATTAAALREDFNALLKALRAAGLMAAEAVEQKAPATKDGGE